MQFNYNRIGDYFAATRKLHGWKREIKLLLEVIDLLKALYSILNDGTNRMATW